MKNKQDDIQIIRKMMEESSRFLTLSGLSGIFAGLYALAGAAVAYFMILDSGARGLDYSFDYFRFGTNRTELFYLLLDALVVLILALSTAWLVSYNKAKRENKSFWTRTAKRMLVNLFIPLIAGGLFILAMLYHNDTMFVSSSLLIFYGLALLNASKYTLGEIKYLGLSEIATGIISLFFLGYSFVFAIFGFSILHIIYGFVMWKKYK
ncbi:hypothetical protein ACE01N_08540 [Saccharicrinis sp. FJH2]|uniref:hypothetical protein n=1 Tax=unclassified Saccharicrinis TaxID=2646859 RepID=UPI0035D447AB